MILFFPSLIVKLIEGENDGLLTPASAEWTNFQGVMRGATNRGISHCDEVDLRRFRFTKKQSEGRISDITAFYKMVVTNLKSKGF